MNKIRENKPDGKIDFTNIKSISLPLFLYEYDQKINTITIR